MPVGFAAALPRSRGAAWLFGDLLRSARRDHDRAHVARQDGRLPAACDPVLSFRRAADEHRRHHRAAVQFRRGAGPPGTRRARARQCACQRAVRRHVGLGDGRRRRPRANRDAGDERRRLRSPLQRRHHGRLVAAEPDHPAEHRAGRLCGAGAGLGRRAVLRRHRARAADGGRVHGLGRVLRPPSTAFHKGTRATLAEIWTRVPTGGPRPAHARHHP